MAPVTDIAVVNWEAAGLGPFNSLHFGEIGWDMGLIRVENLRDLNRDLWHSLRNRLLDLVLELRFDLVLPPSFLLLPIAFALAVLLPLFFVLTPILLALLPGSLLSLPILLFGFPGLFHLRFIAFSEEFLHGTPEFMALFLLPVLAFPVSFLPAVIVTVAIGRRITGSAFTGVVKGNFLDFLEDILVGVVNFGTGLRNFEIVGDDFRVFLA